MDYTPLWISLRTSLLATGITFFAGILAAYYVVKMNRLWKGVTDCVLTMPMILPPTVVGFFLLKLFGVNGPIGQLFMDVFNTKIVFSWQATVISSAIVAFPLMYRTMRGTFEQFDRTIVYSAQTLGLSNSYIFWRIILPNCRYGMIAGTVLAFARGLGEFGATIMLAGNIPGKTRTISTAVYSAMAAGDDALAYKWVLVNLTLSFIVMLAMNLANEKAQRQPGIAKSV